MNEMDVLRAAQPDVPPPGQQAWDTALDRLADAAAGPRPEPVRRWPRPRRLIMAGALGTAIVLGVAVLPGPDGGGTRPASAAEILGRAAAYARTDPVPTPKPGQWIYIESRERGVPGTSLGWPVGDFASPKETMPVLVRYWLASQGGQRFKPGTSRGCPPSARECTPWVPPVSTVLQVNGQEVRIAEDFSPSLPPWRPDDSAFVQSLPTDRDALLKQIYGFADQRKDDGSREQEAFSMITELLDSWAPSRLRAALFQVLAKIPGVMIDNDAVDLTGRHGIGFIRSEGVSRRQIILDRFTYRFLGQKAVATKPIYNTIKPGTVLLWTSQLRLTVVDKARQLP